MYVSPIAYVLIGFNRFVDTVSNKLSNRHALFAVNLRIYGCVSFVVLLVVAGKETC